MTDRDDSMLEQRLREALQPVDPPAQFAERVTSAAERARASASSLSRQAPSGSAARRPWLDRRAGLSVAATAAFVVALAGAGTLWHQHTQQLRAHEAREQILRALRISSEALNAALRATANPSQSG